MYVGGPHARTHVRTHLMRRRRPRDDFRAPIDRTFPRGGPYGAAPPRMLAAAPTRRVLFFSGRPGDHVLVFESGWTTRGDRDRLTDAPASGVQLPAAEPPLDGGADKSEWPYNPRCTLSIRRRFCVFRAQRADRLVLSNRAKDETLTKRFRGGALILVDAR